MTPFINNIYNNYFSDEVHFVLDQYASLDLYSAILLK